MMIYFYQNKLLHMYFLKNTQSFYDLLFTRSNFKCLFAIDLFSLINVEAVSLYHNRPHSYIE